MPQERAERLRALYERHGAALWQYAMRLTGDRVRAEDVVGRTLLAAADRPELLEHSEGAALAALFASAREHAGRTGHQRHADAEGPLPLRDDAAGDPPPELLPSLLARVEPHPHRIRGIVLGVGAVVVLVAVAYAVTLIPVTPTGPSATMPQGPSAPVTDQPMRPVVATPLTADVSVIEQEWGTRIDAVGHYQPPPGGGYGSDPGRYEMVVTDRNGARTTVAEWTAVAGDTVTPSGSTDLPMLWVDRVDIRSVTTDQVLLTATF